MFDPLNHVLAELVIQIDADRWMSAAQGDTQDRAAASKRIKNFAF
jgi:hypothetical protein